MGGTIYLAPGCHHRQTLLAMQQQLCTLPTALCKLLAPPDMYSNRLGVMQEFFLGSGGLFGLLHSLVDEVVPGSGPCYAVGNALLQASLPPCHRVPGACRTPAALGLAPSCQLSWASGTAMLWATRLCRRASQWLISAHTRPV